jgi:Mrp family chromosome partitioning ATPase
MPESVKTSEEHLIYQVDERYHSINNYLDLVNEDQDRNPIIPDYVLIELPPLLHHPYPSGLVATSDLAVMVCRSNRSWSEADQGALDTFKKLTRVNPMFILNGVESQVVKSMIGSLPKKRRGFRRKVKKMANS